MANIAYKSEYYGVVGLGDSLYHHGIKGQKWGIRRYQNEDGSLTVEGKARYKTAERDIAKEEYKDALKRRSSNKASKSDVKEAFDRYVAASSWTERKMADDAKRGNVLLELERLKTAKDERKQAKFEKKRAKAIASADPDEILPYIPTLNTDQVKDAWLRADYKKKLKDIKAGYDKEEKEKKAEKLKAFADAGKKLSELREANKKRKEEQRKEADKRKLSYETEYESNKLAAAKAAANDARKNTPGTVGDREKAAKVAFMAVANGDKKTAHGLAGMKWGNRKGTTDNADDEKKKKK